MADNVDADIAVITVSELKEWLDVQGTAQDKNLKRATFIATYALEAECKGTAFIQRTFTEDYAAGQVPGRRGGAKRIHLFHGPIVSVTSITDDDSNTVASTDYTIVSEAGYLEHDALWPSPVGRWTIVYTAGVFADTDDVSWNVKNVAMSYAARIHKNKGGDAVKSRSRSGRSGSSSITYDDPSKLTAYEMKMLSAAGYVRGWV